jgi:L-ascorbate metabolism protein UlaG (beta-lactamase superfamily)
MKFQWFGASHFLATTASGTRIAMDPFQYNIIVEGDNPPPGGNVIRPTYSGDADIVTMTHGHFDHSYLCAIQGVPRLYTGGEARTFKDVRLDSVATYHGANRGYNHIILMEADGLRICHVGDHGHVLKDHQLSQIGRVDILMTSWDDDPSQMTFDVLDVVLGQLKPKVVFPMHHTLVNEFMTGRKHFIDHRLDNVTEVAFTPDTLPSEMTVILIKPSFDNPINFFAEPDA